MGFIKKIFMLIGFLVIAYISISLILYYFAGGSELQLSLWGFTSKMPVHAWEIFKNWITNI